MLKLIFFKYQQSLKVFALISLIELGIEIEEICVPSNAPSPMFSIPFFKVNSFRFLKFLNASFSIDFTFSGIVTEAIFLSPFVKSLVILSKPLSNFILQFSKEAFSSISSTFVPLK
nr:hypothetical protein [Metamycoplasma hominis]